MNKLKLGKTKQKLVLTEGRESLKIKRDSEVAIKIPFRISSLKNDQTPLQDQNPTNRKVSVREKRSNSTIIQRSSPLERLENQSTEGLALKRGRAPSRFQQLRARVQSAGVTQAGDCESLLELVGRLVEKMKDVDSVMVVNWGKGYSINKTQLKELLHYFILSLANQPLPSPSPFPTLDYLLQAIRLTQFKNSSNIDSQCPQLPSLFEQNKDVRTLKEVMEGLEARNRELRSRIVAQQKELRAIELERLHMQEITNELQEFHKYLKMQVEDKQKEYEMRVKSNRRLQSIINEDYRTRVLFMASCEYKNIEQQTYEYALRLQNTQLTSYLDFQPQLFTEIEQLIMDELKVLNRKLVESDWSTEQKGIKMREFLISSLKDLKKKDEELRKMNAFKTQCIRSYIHQMKRWHENWSLKKEYLSILREQFMIDTNTVNQQLNRLRQQVVTDTRCEVDYASIMVAFKRIQDNFQIGNTFY